MLLCGIYVREGSITEGCRRFLARCSFHLAACQGCFDHQTEILRPNSRYVEVVCLCFLADVPVFRLNSVLRNMF
jgi:hypothetical protein